MEGINFTGRLRKMKTSLNDGVAQYQLRLKTENDEHLQDLNDFVGKRISLNFTGNIFDIHDESPIKKSYGQGYSYKNFISLAECDSCILSPEKCHYHLGTCRDPKWGEENCMIDHYVYLSNSSGLKIGITRHTQIPTRWIDQGAISAIPLVLVKDRMTSGLIEAEIKKELNDRTNWRKMLTNDIEEVDLEEKREEIFNQFADVFDNFEAEEVEDATTEIEFPVDSYPKKVKSLNFDKSPLVEGVLTGIKGQYLMFGDNVINLRKFQGYEVEFNA